MRLGEPSSLGLPVLATTAADPPPTAAPAGLGDWDIVYSEGGPIEIASLVLEYEDGTSEEIIKDGQYTMF
jgi:hypothetical protein